MQSAFSLQAFERPAPEGSIVGASWEQRRGRAEAFDQV
jgi:hypothetical protein